MLFYRACLSDMHSILTLQALLIHFFAFGQQNGQHLQKCS